MLYNGSNTTQLANPDKFKVIFIGLEIGQKLSLEINGISLRTTELLGTGTSTKPMCFTRLLSTFNYFPLIWMLCGKIANNRINQ